MRRWLTTSWASRFSKSRTQSKASRRALAIEPLEERWTPSWTATPPPSIPVPAHPTAVNISAIGGAQGNAAIAGDEIDYYSFVAPRSGPYQFTAATPNSSVDTVLAVYSQSGQRLAYN